MAGKAAQGGECSGTRGLVLVGTDKGQLRQGSQRNWSEAKQREFLTVLAETCNVTQAAAEAGVSVSHAYRRRKSNAAFRAAWLEALGTAYQRLELVLLDRAFNGTEKVIKRNDGSEERMLEYSNQLGLALLKMHRDTAAEASTDMPAADVEEIRERILKKLQRLKKRTDQGDSAAG